MDEACSPILVQLHSRGDLRIPTPLPHAKTPPWPLPDEIPEFVPLSFCALFLT